VNPCTPLDSPRMEARLSKFVRSFGKSKTRLCFRRRWGSSYQGHHQPSSWIKKAIFVFAQNTSCLSGEAYLIAKRSSAFSIGRVLGTQIYYLVSLPNIAVCRSNRNVTAIVPMSTILRFQACAGLPRFDSGRP